MCEEDLDRRGGRDDVRGAGDGEPGSADAGRTKASPPRDERAAARSERAVVVPLERARGVEADESGGSDDGPFDDDPGPQAA